MLGIHKLDDCGAAQLKADLDYLINVTQALSLPRHALLDHMGALAAMDREAFNATLGARPQIEERGPACVGGRGGGVCVSSRVP